VALVIVKGLQLTLKTT